MTSDDLQKTINPNIPITGGNEFKIIVAKEGMTYSLSEQQQQNIKQHDRATIGTELLIESLQKYVIRFEKDVKNNKLKLMIEDRINRFDLSFDSPQKDQSHNNILYAKGEKGMLATGPYLKMEIIEASSAEGNSSATAKLHVYKGRKDLFNDDISINNNDAIILKKYVMENF